MPWIYIYIQKKYLSFLDVILSKIIFLNPNSFMLFIGYLKRGGGGGGGGWANPHWIRHWLTVHAYVLCVYIVKAKIKSCGRSWSAQEGTIYEYTKAVLGKNCVFLIAVILSKNDLFEPNSFMDMLMCLHCEVKVSNCCIKSCGRSWSSHEGTICANIRNLYFFHALLFVVHRGCCLNMGPNNC